MAVCTPATNAVDRLLDLLDELERVIVELRRQVEDERGEL
jgi:hypothetical protein